MTNYHLFSRFVLVVAFVLLQGCGSSSNPGSSSSSNAPPPPPPTGPQFVYIGTNAQPGNPTEIVIFPVNPGTGALGPSIVMPTSSVIGSVADPFGRALYTADGVTGAVHEYTINGTTGALTEISGSPFSVPGLPPPSQNPQFTADLYTNAQGNFVYENNCGFSRNSAGGLTPIPGSCFPLSGASRTAADPSGKFLFQTCDLGDTLGGLPICLIAVNQSTGQLQQAGTPPTVIQFRAADVVVHPSGNFVYASGLIQNFPPTPSTQQIVVFSFNAATGGFTFQGGNGLPVPNQFSALAVTPNGKFVYAVDPTNIYVFAMSPSGSLLPISGFPFPGGHTFQAGSRALQFDNTGQFLYMAATDINAVVGFKVDPNTGVFSPIPGSPFAIGATPSTMVVVRTP
jgi:6-phosphogluconolactonase